MKFNDKYTFRGTEIYDLVEAYLERVTRRRADTNYARVGRIMGLGRSFGPQWHEPITCLLVELAEDDARAHRPSLCAVVAIAGRKRRGGGRYPTKGPGKGFYLTMWHVHRKADKSEDVEFWRRELEDLYEYYESIPSPRAQAPSGSVVPAAAERPTPVPALV